jgi:D-tyrosyl-tRNA(Tyr) deacylase
VRAVLQRASRARVTVGKQVIGEINRGLLVLLGVGRLDSEAEADRLLDKILGLRIFADADGKMNLSIEEVEGELLVVSQFTLFADVRRGRRPSFIDAAPPDQGKRLYEYFVDKARARLPRVATGEFGAMMNVELVNDGPVTIVIDTEELR